MALATDDDVGTSDVRPHGISKNLATRQDRSPEENCHVNLGARRGGTIPAQQRKVSLPEKPREHIEVASLLTQRE